MHNDSSSSHSAQRGGRDALRSLARGRPLRPSEGERWSPPAQRQRERQRWTEAARAAPRAAPGGPAGLSDGQAVLVSLGACLILGVAGGWMVRTTQAPRVARPSYSAHRPPSFPVVLGLDGFRSRQPRQQPGQHHDAECDRQLGADRPAEQPLRSGRLALLPRLLEFLPHVEVIDRAQRQDRRGTERSSDARARPYDSFQKSASLPT